MWDIHRRLHIDRFPSRRTLLKFDIRDAPSAARFYWLVIERGRVDICLKDPGHPVDLGVDVDLRTMTDVWLGDFEMAEAVRTGKLRLDGPKELADASAPGCGSASSPTSTARRSKPDPARRSSGSRPKVRLSKTPV